MHNDASIKTKVFTRRAMLLGAGKISLLSILLGRLYYLQIIKSKEYKTLSENNSIKLFLIPPLRGNILDRHSTPLAINQHYYRIMFDKERGADEERQLIKLAEILQLDQEQIETMRQRVKHGKFNSQVLLHNHLNWEEVVRMEVNYLELPNINVDVGQARYYPMSDLYAHITGYIGAPSEKEISNKVIFNHPDIKIGKNGIEKTFNEHLSGKAGVKRMEVDAYGVIVRELSKEDSKTGNDLTLTLDSTLQRLVTSKLNPKGAASVFLDARDGSILAMNSTPGFDPNRFSQGLTNEYWEELTTDPYFPLINKAISVQYPPGSIFKLVTALAALKANIDPHTFTVHCPGHMMLGERRFHCWRDGGHGEVNMETAIPGSCNVYFWTIAKLIGFDKIAQMANTLGLGQKTGIELSNEAAGLIPNKAWKKKRFTHGWQTGDTINCSVGQGFVLATPIQLALMAARIASGKALSPRLILKPNHNQILTPHEPLAIPEQHLTIIRNGMENVVNSPGGTAYAAQIPNTTIKMAGKTGTSQVISKRYAKEDLSKSNVAWINKNHGLFIGYLPAQDPIYAFSVIVEHGGSGYGAALVARDIIMEMQKNAHKFGLVT